MTTLQVGETQGDLSPFVESNDLLEDPGRLRERARSDGYVFIRDLVDNNAILGLRRDITAILSGAGWLDDGSKPLDAISTQDARLSGTPEFVPIYDMIQRRESFHTMAHEKSLLNVAEGLLGEPGMPQPSSIAQVIFPTRLEYTTPPHQDLIHVQGTPEAWTCWIPLGPLPHAMGGLAVLCGSHEGGVLPVHEAKGAGGLGIEPKALKGDWLSSPFALGDALFFHSKTVHQGLPNVSGNRLRLSVDYRYQKRTDLIMENNLGVHQGRLTWEQVYAGWQSDEFRYFWRSHQRQSVTRVPAAEFK